MHYDEIQALYDVSLDIKEGEIVSIVGSNGAGKSTILNTISGIFHTYSGKIIFRGEEIQNYSPHLIVERGIIQIPEARRVFPYMSIMENLDLGAYVQRARKKRKKNLEIIFDLFPKLEERKNQTASTLSGGEQQMLAIARGLMADPFLIMLDEPSLGLAPILVNQIFDIISQIKETGITVLLVEQNVFHSLQMSDRGYVLENGRVVLEGKGEYLLQDKKVIKAYLGI